MPVARNDTAARFVASNDAPTLKILLTAGRSSLHSPRIAARYLDRCRPPRLFPCATDAQPRTALPDRIIGRLPRLSLDRFPEATQVHPHRCALGTRDDGKLRQLARWLPGRRRLCNLDRGMRRSSGGVQAVRSHATLSIRASLEVGLCATCLRPASLQMSCAWRNSAPLDLSRCIRRFRKRSVLYISWRRRVDRPLLVTTGDIRYRPLPHEHPRARAPLPRTKTTC